jgi:hypothetical protein
MQNSQATEAWTPADFRCRRDLLRHKVADGNHDAYVISTAVYGWAVLSARLP